MKRFWYHQIGEVKTVINPTLFEQNKNTLVGTSHAMAQILPFDVSTMFHHSVRI